jgi:hypothetical protein
MTINWSNCWRHRWFQVAVLRPSNTVCYLNVTQKNIEKVLFIHFMLVHFYMWAATMWYGLISAFFFANVSCSQQILMESTYVAHLLLMSAFFMCILMHSPFNSRYQCGMIPIPTCLGKKLWCCCCCTNVALSINIVFLLLFLLENGISLLVLNNLPLFSLREWFGL